MVISRKMSTFANVIELTKHIETLLLSHDCVIVPDFGGFTAHYVDARYDGRDNMFLPPQRTIGFNPQLTINDSLLAQSYADTYDISYPEALNRIAGEVAEMRQTLESLGSCELNGVGTLSLNQDGKYSFEPYEEGIMTPELYGLGGFDMRPLSETVITEEDYEDDFVFETETTSIPLHARNQTVFGTTGRKDGKNTKSAEYITIKKSLLRNFTAACIALVAFFALSTPLESPNLQKSQIDTGLLTRIMPKDITSVKDTHKLVLNQEAKAGESTDEAKLDEGTKKSKKVVALKEDEEIDSNIPYYSIVLASRVTKHNAANYAERLQEKGFKATRVQISDSNVKVIYGTYSTEDQAYSELNRLRSNEVFADGWITLVNE